MSLINCFGIIVIDALGGPINDFPKHGQQVIAKNLRFYPGGGAANTSIALGKMGFAPKIFSKIGDDAFRTLIETEFRKHNVDYANMKISQQENTPFTYVAVHPNGQRSFIHTPDTNLSFSLNDIDMEQLLDTSFLIYNDLFVLPKIDAGDGVEILHEAQQRGVVTLLDECYGFGPRQDLLEALLPYTDYFMPSYDDMHLIYPDFDDKQMIEYFHGLGTKNVIIKKGPEGCVVSDAGQIDSIPAFPVEIVDTTGAGDCWDAGFIAALTKGKDIFSAARYGNFTASLCIGGVGGSAGILPYEKIEEKFKSRNV